MKFLNHIKLNNIFNYVTVFLLIPFAVTLILLFAYTAYTTRIHQQGIFHTAADDIAENVEASLVGVMNETRMATYSNDFIYFCNSSSYESVDRYGQTVMAESQTGIFSYPEVVCMVLNNTSCGYYLPSFRSFDALFFETGDGGHRRHTLCGRDGGCLDGAGGEQAALHFLLNRRSVRFYYYRGGPSEESGLCQLLFHL